jgi:4-amino-4-deoxy-L-arabinose transferase-like glycosyltransferase
LCAVSSPPQLPAAVHIITIVGVHIYFLSAHSMKIIRSFGFQTAVILLLAAAWKMLLLFWDVFPFNADEAVVALMARHILMGERPVFFYGQAYMGSLDAFLVAAGFLLFGQQVWVIRLVQGILYLATLLVVAFTGKEAFDSPRTGVLAALLLAVPTVNVTLYTTASLGGYGEALLIGCLALLLAVIIVRRRLAEDTLRAGMVFGLWGFLVGFGLWANGLSLVFSAPAGLYLLWGLWNRRRAQVVPLLTAAVLGFFIGSLPWWAFLAQNGPQQLVQELFGTAVAVERASWLERTGAHLVNFLLLGTTVTFGFRPPWNVRWLGLPLLPFVLIFWAAVIGFFARSLRRPKTALPTADENDRATYALLAGVCAVLLAGFLFTPFGVDPSGRYFLPLSIPLALVAARMILHLAHRPWLAGGLLALVIGYQMWGTLQCARQYPPGLTTQFYEPTVLDHRAMGALMEFLRSEGETRGYTTYWVAYPLAFHSAEEIIFVPRLPYHLDLRYTPRDDRYALYTQIVDGSPRVAYITARNPALDEHLRAEFTRMGVAWQEKIITDYHVYYQLSRPVRPQEIGLGVLRQ